VIHSRSRPLDRKKVLLNDDESKIVEKEWAEFNRHQHLAGIISAVIPDDTDAVITRVYHELCGLMDKEPSGIDILMNVNEQKATRCLQDGMYNRYRYHVLFLSDIYSYEGRQTESLRLLLQVIFLDMNGISNAGKSKKKVFDLKSASVSPDLLGEIRSARIKLGIDMDGMKAEFIRSATDVSRIIAAATPPLEPEEAWQQISRMVE
jgi:hypothetical protein